MRVSFLLSLFSSYGGELGPFMLLRDPVYRRRIRYSRDNDLCSLPGAAGMYALSLGIQNMGQSLPLPVYGLLSGLNASIVGIIALAAVQLADKAIRDKLTRIEVLFGACAGVCYNALWYFPLLMLVGGLSSVIWDGWMAQQLRRLRVSWQSRHSRLAEPEEAAIPPSGNSETQPVRLSCRSLAAMAKDRIRTLPNTRHQ